jgi:hypothetical protein
LLTPNGCLGRNLGYRFWLGPSCGGQVLVDQSAETLSASDLADFGREWDHVRGIVGEHAEASLRLPKCHPCRSSGGVVVLVEDAAQSLASVDVETGDLGLAGDRLWQWL